MCLKLTRPISIVQPVKSMLQQKEGNTRSEKTHKSMVLLDFRELIKYISNDRKILRENDFYAGTP